MKSIVDKNLGFCNLCSTNVATLRSNFKVQLSLKLLEMQKGSS